MKERERGQEEERVGLKALIFFVDGRPHMLATSFKNLIVESLFHVKIVVTLVASQIWMR